MFDIQTHKNFRTSKTIIQNRCFFSYFSFWIRMKISGFYSMGFYFGLMINAEYRKSKTYLWDGKESGRILWSLLIWKALESLFVTLAQVQRFCILCEMDEWGRGRERESRRTATGQSDVKCEKCLIFIERFAFIYSWTWCHIAQKFVKTQHGFFQFAPFLPQSSFSSDSGCLCFHSSFLSLSVFSTLTMFLVPTWTCRHTIYIVICVLFKSYAGKSGRKMGGRWK